MNRPLRQAAIVFPLFVPAVAARVSADRKEIPFPRGYE